MATKELEVKAGQGPVTFHIFGEETGDGAPDRPWCGDFEEAE